MMSALGFGFFFLGMDRASDADMGWAMLVNRITGVTLLVSAAVILRPPIRAGRRDLPALAGIGLARYRRERDVRRRRHDGAREHRVRSWGRSIRSRRSGSPPWCFTSARTGWHRQASRRRSAEWC